MEIRLVLSSDDLYLCFFLKSKNNDSEESRGERPDDD